MKGRGMQLLPHLRRRMRTSSPSSVSLGPVPPPPRCAVAASASLWALVRARLVRWKGPNEGSAASSQRP